MAASFDAVVIGAGANGLVAAAALGKAGLRVLLLESRDAVGGQGRFFEFAPGFQAAPLTNDASWVPPAVAKLLGTTLAHRSSHDQLNILVGPSDYLTLSSNVARAVDSLRRFSAEDAAKWPDFSKRLHKLSTVLNALYQQPAPDIETKATRELLGLLGVARRLRSLGRTDMTEFLRMLPMSVEEVANDWFECEPLKAAIAAHGVRELRQGPRSGGTTFVLLHYLTGAPMGSFRHRRWHAGPDAFVRAAEDAARRHNVTIRTDAEVANIKVQDDAVTGVVLADGEEIGTTRVVSTVDPARTLLGMIDPVWLDPEFLHAVRNIKYRGCTSYVLYALDPLPELPNLAPDNWRSAILLTSSMTQLERAADSAKYGQLPELPHIELSVPTERWPERSFAPKGRHVMIARVQYTPYQLRNAEWDSTKAEALGDQVTTAIDLAIPCLSSRILHRTVLTPRDVETRYGLTEAAHTHGEMMLDQILFMRPVPGWDRYAMPIAGLYMGGAGTHPGPGILGGSGILAAQRVLADRGGGGGKRGR